MIWNEILVVLGFVTAGVAYYKRYTDLVAFLTRIASLCRKLKLAEKTLASREDDLDKLEAKNNLNCQKLVRIHKEEISRLTERIGELTAAKSALQLANASAFVIIQDKTEGLDAANTIVAKMELEVAALNAGLADSANQTEFKINTAIEKLTVAKDLELEHVKTEWRGLKDKVSQLEEEYQKLECTTQLALQNGQKAKIAAIKRASTSEEQMEIMSIEHIKALQEFRERHSKQLANTSDPINAHIAALHLEHEAEQKKLNIKFNALEEQLDSIKEIQKQFVIDCDALVKKMKAEYKEVVLGLKATNQTLVSTLETTEKKVEQLTSRLENIKGLGALGIDVLKISLESAKKALLNQI